jgi:hypothetical protein
VRGPLHRQGKTSLGITLTPLSKKPFRDMASFTVPVRQIMASAMAIGETRASSAAQIRRG